VVGDVPIDSEAPEVTLLILGQTLSILRPTGSIFQEKVAQMCSYGLFVCVYRDEHVYIFICVYVVLYFTKRNYGTKGQFGPVWMSWLPKILELTEGMDVRLD
jgi:hypothetical protein